MQRSAPRDRRFGRASAPGSGSSGTRTRAGVGEGASSCNQSAPRAHSHAVVAATATPAATPSAIHFVARVIRSAGTSAASRLRSIDVGESLDGAARAIGRLEAIEPVEKRQRFLARRAALDRRRQETPGRGAVAADERVDTGVEQLFAFPLLLGDRAARALDVGARPGMSVIQEQDPRPDADGEVVVTGEVMVEAAEEEIFDAGVTLALRHVGPCWRAIGA